MAVASRLEVEDARRLSLACALAGDPDLLVLDDPWVDNLAAAIGEERDTIEDVLEPFLIQQGYLQRTPRGRMAPASTYRHFGLTVPSPSGNAELWREN